MSLDVFNAFREVFRKEGVIFAKNLDEVHALFGDEWAEDFGSHLERLLGNDENAYRNAMRGYAKFSLDAMRLQMVFNRKHQYETQSYEEACQKVYMNEDFMMNLYLPGIFVSQFLWRHHYRQIQFYRQKFLPDWRAVATSGSTMWAPAPDFTRSRCFDITRTFMVSASISARMRACSQQSTWRDGVSDRHSLR